MKNLLLTATCVLMACGPPNKTQEQKDRNKSSAQQEQYAIGQPVPVYDFSLERQMLIDLYNLRNMRVATHVVWRSNTGMIEGDCSAIGFGIPYDTSLTNPYQVEYRYEHSSGGATAIGQAEPNGVFASTNTSATWVLCTGDAGGLMPIYVEAKVTGYPYPIVANYETYRVERVTGSKAVTISLKKPSSVPKKKPASTK